MDNISPLSPPIIEQEPETISFYEALKQLTKGKTIRRTSWPEEDYGLLVDGFVTIHRNNEFKRWMINDGDLDGTDWIVQ